jgi:hypothetical protein
MNRWMKIALTVVASTLTLQAVNISPARAAATAIGVFYAACARFSVDVAVTGVTDDGNAQDKFRYVVVDSNGKVLYSEDASRRVGITGGSLVINFNYTGGQPTKNPVRFQVLDLDGNNNVTSVLKEVSYDAKCLAASGLATSTRDFRPPTFLKATVLTTTPLYSAPGRDQLTLTVAAGKEHLAIYRTADGLWVAIDVGGNDLVWVPTAALSVDITRLGTPPTRIDLADPARAAVSLPTGGIPSPTGVTAVVTTLLRFRALPTTASEIITRIPADTEVAVLGRTFNNRWLKVLYNGVPGWISSGFVILSKGAIRDLPVLEQ